MQTQLGAQQLRCQTPHTESLHVPVPTVLENDQRNIERKNMSRSVCGICMCLYGDAGDCACEPKGETPMTKEEALQAIKLMSALESWAFSTGSLLPDYLHDNLQRSLAVLERIVLEKKQ